MFFIPNFDSGKKQPKNDLNRFENDTKTMQKRCKNDPRTIQERFKNDDKTIQERSKNDQKTMQGLIKVNLTNYGFEIFEVL